MHLFGTERMSLIALSSLSRISLIRPDSCLAASLCAGHLSERQPEGPVSVAVTAAAPDSLNPGEIRICFESDGWKIASHS